MNSPDELINSQCYCMVEQLNHALYAYAHNDSSPLQAYLSDQFQAICNSSTIFILGTERPALIDIWNRAFFHELVTQDNQLLRLVNQVPSFVTYCLNLSNY